MRGKLKNRTNPETVCDLRWLIPVQREMKTAFVCYHIPSEICNNTLSPADEPERLERLCTFFTLQQCILGVLKGR